ncbi:MAG: hypothetical protein LBC18_10665 [Opitutaceae bacterium]|jgi:hypothetical protein|nr:hypothetical protein [Opitutaceae bacterium]
MNPLPLPPQQPPAPPEWARLAAAARRAAAARDTAAPHGFAARLVARAMGLAAAARPAAAPLFARFSLRALGFACLLAIASVALNYGAIVNAMREDIATLGEPVALVDSSDQAS